MTSRQREKPASLMGRVAGKARWGYRQATSSFRSLPDFIVIGAPRCGTTSLWEHLSVHPDVRPAIRKELHFFDFHYQRGLPWYRAHFPITRSIPTGAVTGEATPNYLGHPDAANRVRTAAPEAKLVVLLRNPVDRAHSAWQLKVREGVEPLGFSEAVKAEESRLAGGNRRSEKDLRFAYLGKSRYAEQLEAWFAVFPKEQFAIYKSEEILAGDTGALAELYSFLGLRTAPETTNALPKANAAPRSEQIDQGLHRELSEYFSEHNQRLYTLIGRDLGWT